MKRYYLSKSKVIYYQENLIKAFYEQDFHNQRHAEICKT